MFQRLALTLVPIQRNPNQKHEAGPVTQPRIRTNLMFTTVNYIYCLL